MVEILECQGVDVIDFVVKDFKAGLKQRELAAKHGVSNRTISKWLKERGEEVLPGNLRGNVCEREVFEFMESGGNTKNAIMKRFGISAKRAQYFFDKKLSLTVSSVLTRPSF